MVGGRDGNVSVRASAINTLVVSVSVSVSVSVCGTASVNVSVSVRES
jgi:hypothetical protein